MNTGVQKILALIIVVFIGIVILYEYLTVKQASDYLDACIYVQGKSEVFDNEACLEIYEMYMQQSIILRFIDS